MKGSKNRVNMIIIIAKTTPPNDKNVFSRRSHEAHENTIFQIPSHK